MSSDKLHSIQVHWQGKIEHHFTKFKISQIEQKINETKKAKKLKNSSS